MKKVIYSVSRYRKGDIEKNTGIGYITDRDLVIACISKNGKPYIRVFADCVKQWHIAQQQKYNIQNGHTDINHI